MTAQTKNPAPAPAAEADGQTAEAPAEAAPKKPQSSGPGWQRFKDWYLGHKKWAIPVTVILVIVILAAVPFTRYHIAGVVLKRDVSLKVVDATAGTPVSGASVSIGSIGGETNSSGQVTLRHVKVGNHTVTISKKYYRDGSANILAPIFSQKKVPAFGLSATGRQVKISVANLINKTALAGVNIAVAGVTAKTDGSGSAVVVLPVGISQQPATLSLNGYNNAAATVKVSNDSIENNQFSLTPAGRIYFLSKLSGTIDVVKTNLDGSGRQTVLAGTGHEDDQNTVLLASRDWKYLALLSRRAGNSPSLYLIDTSNDLVTTIDEGDVDFTLLGWSDNYFTYVVDQHNTQPWQPGGESIKSYNAQTKKLETLDSTNATGTSVNDAAYETYVVQPILLDNLIVYVKTWYQYPGYLQVSGQSNTLNVVKPDGTGKKTIKSVDAGQLYFGSMVFHAPGSVYVQASNFNDGSSTYYEFNGIGLTQKNNLTNDDIFKTYPTYLYSPDDNSTFWAEPRDGKNTLFVGDSDGQNAKQIATLSDYSPYGWYTGNYLLVSKNASELYIIPKNGGGNTVKISDYHKPAQTFNGYGGGYGGL